MATIKPSIFICYSHSDSRWKDLIATHLRALERDGRLRLWDDRLIEAGSDWLPQIQQEIVAAKAVVLLVSPAFLDSQFVLAKEVPALLERRIRDGLRIFPVLLEPCLWEEIDWLARMQMRTYLRGKALNEVPRAKRDRALIDLTREIIAVLSSQDAPSREKPNVGSSPPLRVNQLPAPPLDFTGREAELKTLQAAVREGKTTAIFGVHGMGGVGKTTLALKLAHEIAPLYPDGQIFLDLQGVTTHLSAAEAMAHVIRSFHPGRQLPAAEGELAPLYRSVLHGKRVLLLMDNAAGRNQVEPLVPPEGSALLVTSRVRFALPGLVERDLDALPREASRELLLKICPRIGKHAEDLASVCGDLPLALRVAASTLQERRILSCESYLQGLSTGLERLEPIETALSLSYELLSRELRLRWCQMAVFPDTFDREAAAAVWEVKADVAEPFLVELERNSLLEGKETSERYRLHDLVRSFVEERLEEKDRQAAKGRHAHHYLKVLSLAEGLVLKGGEDLIHGLKLFDLEWSNIQAGQAFTASEAHRTDESAKLCSDYPRIGTYCLRLRLTSKEWLTWLEAALTSAKLIGDRQAEAWHLGNLGSAYRELGEPRRAIELYEQNLSITLEIGDRRGQGNVLGNLGNAYASLGEPRRAIDLCEQYLAITREIGDRRSEGNALGTLGQAYAQIGEPQRAIQFYEQHLAVAREIGDRRGEFHALGNLGIAYAGLGEPRRAIEFYEERLDIAREIGDRWSEGHTMRNLGIAYADLGEPSRAIEFYEQCLAIAREIGDRRGESNAFGNLGQAYASLGETRRAVEFYDQQLTIAREIGDRQGEAIGAWNLGLIYAHDDPARAVELMQVLVNFEREIGHPDAGKDAATVQSIMPKLASSDLQSDALSLTYYLVLRNHAPVDLLLHLDPARVRKAVQESLLEREVEAQPPPLWRAWIESTQSANLERLREALRSRDAFLKEDWLN